MGVTKRKSSSALSEPLGAQPNGNKESFRALKAFGLWAHRGDLKDPVQFTKELRARLERGDDAR
jgi:hypothetical protein